MLKYVETDVVFEEIPNEVTLAINISGCPCRCPDCHSKHLWSDVGSNLSYNTIDRLIEENKGITCICFMGGDGDASSVNALAEHIKFFYGDINVGWYSGREEVSQWVKLKNFDYIKLGHFDKKYGPLNRKGTNQRLYRIMNEEMIDITDIFWK